MALRFVFYFLLLTLLACKKEGQSADLTMVENTPMVKYAGGFRISSTGGITTLTVKNTYPGSTESFTYALINRKYTDSVTLAKDAFDAVVLTPLRSIVVTSTTHLPALDLLNVTDRLIGFPGLDYISSEAVRDRIRKDELRELGSNEGLNTEIIIDLKPEAVIGFNVAGSNKPYELIERAGIPVLLNGDWVEGSPLAKAEWIKFFGVLFEKEKEADSIFDKIEKQYLSAKSMAVSIENSPTVMSGAVYRDVWYLPNGNSPEAQFLNDAGANYLWKDSAGTGSLELSFETVLEHASQADIWISPSSYKSLDEMINANPHYAQFKAFKERNVWSFANTTGEKGGIVYYELGSSRPDLVLKDIIKICHPKLLPDYETTFFKPLE